MENKYSNKYLIETGSGLQDVDHLKNSSYFISESERYIRGEISLFELEDIITSYYKQKPEEAERTEEADISLDTFIITKKAFIKLLKDSSKVSELYSIKE